MTVVKKSNNRRSGGGGGGGICTCCCCVIRTAFEAMLYLGAGVLCGCLLAIFGLHNNNDTEGTLLTDLVAAATISNNNNNGATTTTTTTTSNTNLRSSTESDTPPAVVVADDFGKITTTTLDETTSISSGTTTIITSHDTNTNNNKCPLPPNTRIKMMRNSNNIEYKLVLYDDGDFISNKIDKNGFWEIKTIDDMIRLMPDGTYDKFPKPSIDSSYYFYDLGANIGYYSLLYASYGYNVIAFEPDISNIQLIKSSICLNPTFNITLVESALTNTEELYVGGTREKKQSCRLLGRIRTKRTEKYLHSIPRLFCPIPENDPCNNNYDKICIDNVSVTTIDNYIINEKHDYIPSIIKIDVEGHELHVIEGMIDTISKYKPTIIQFENKDTRISETIYTLLQSEGYEISTKRGHDQNTIAVYNIL